MCSFCDGREFAQFILDGLKQGYIIGFLKDAVISQVGRNMLCPDASVVDEYLRREQSLNRLVKVKMSRQEAIRPGVHYSPMISCLSIINPHTIRLLYVTRNNTFSTNTASREPVRSG